MEMSAGSPVIEFRDVVYVLPNGQPLLSGLNLQVQGGETLVLLGRSGSGKTTTLKLINRLLNPSGGGVLGYGGSQATTRGIWLRVRRWYASTEGGLCAPYTGKRE